MNNSLVRMLGVATPIVQAPMAGVMTPALAAAASNAGALGSLGVGAITAGEAAALIQKTRALTSNPFGVNVFCHQPALHNSQREAEWLRWLAPQFAKFAAAPPPALREIYKSFLVDREMLDMLLIERPAVVSFHFGLPDDAIILALRKAGIVLLATATSLAEAQIIERAGIDAIVAQGVEAGGHRGSFDPAAIDEGLSTLALTRLLVRSTRKPIIAAGGIMDGAGIAAALALGAQAAQLGTVYTACPESSIDAGYRRALLEGSDVLYSSPRCRDERRDAS